MKIFALSMNFKPLIPGYDLIEQNYLKYLNKFYVQPLLIPNVIDSIPGYLKHFDISGVILTGGTDIDESFVNSELSQVDVAECVSEGTLISVDERKLILRTAVYPKDKGFGDWTAITLGACVNCRKIT